MQANQLGARTGDRAEYLKQKLDEATSRAGDWNFDLPSDAAVARTQQLFDCLSESGIDLAGIHVNVSADGAISVALSNKRRTAAVEIEPGGETGIVVSDEVARVLLKSVDNPTDTQIVTEFRSAA